MKLKLVVASMSVMGLLSMPAFAEIANMAPRTVTTTTVTPAPMYTHEHNHHCKCHKHETTVMKDVVYKDMPIIIDNHQLIYDAMGQNLFRGHALPDWFNRIGFSGGLNIDAAWGNRGMGYMGENVSRISLNDAFLNTTAIINDWTRGFLSLSFNNASDVLIGAPKNGRYSNVYSINNLNLEQGYITIANYDCSPFFFQIGKQFTDFGRYTIHPIERSMAQVMSESLQTSAKLGFITQSGFHGQIYAYDNGMTRFTEGHPKSVYGAALGYDLVNDQFGFDLGVGYMSQIVGANDVQWAVGSFNGSIGSGPIGTPSTQSSLNGNAGTGGSFVHTVGGIAAYADINTGPFIVSVRYVTAIQHFSPFDLSTQYHTVGGGARPWAVDVTGGFAFTYWNKNQNLYVGYQTSRDTVNLYLPKNRYIFGYNIDMWRNTNLGLQFGHDNDYSAGGYGGTGRSSNTISARAAVRFG